MLIAMLYFMNCYDCGQISGFCSKLNLLNLSKKFCKLVSKMILLFVGLGVDNIVYCVVIVVIYIKCP